MAELKEKVDTDLLQFLINIGLVGVEKNLFKEARAIFSAVAQARPESMEIKLVQSLALVLMGDFVKGGQLASEVLEKHKGNELANGILALSLMCLKQETEAVPLAKGLLKSGKDENAKQFAQKVIDMQSKVLPLQTLQKEQYENITQ